MRADAVSVFGRPRAWRLGLPARVESAWASPGPIRGASMLLASSTSVQMGAALATTLFASVTPPGAAALSLVAGGAMLMAARRPRVGAWPAARLRDVCLLGLAMAAGSVCFYAALHYLPLGTAVTIEFAGPLTLALVAVRRASHLLAALLALLGVALVSSATPAGNLPGLALAFAAACCWAGYILASRRAGRWPRTGDSLAVAVCVGAVATLPFSIAAAPTSTSARRCWSCSPPPCSARCCRSGSSSRRWASCGRRPRGSSSASSRRSRR